MSAEREFQVSDQANRAHRAGVGHLKPKGARFPLIETQVVTSGLAHHLDAGSSIDNASVQLLTLNDDAHAGVAVVVFA